MADIRIADILKTEYSDFLDFCMNADKQYRDELSNADYVAFRSQYGVSREDIAKLPKEKVPIVERVVHTTADPEFAKLLVISNDAVKAGVEAIKAGKPVPWLCHILFGLCGCR